MLHQNEHDKIECIGRGYIVIRRTGKKVNVKASCRGHTKDFTCVSFAREWVQNFPTSPGMF